MTQKKVLIGAGVVYIEGAGNRNATENSQFYCWANIWRPPPLYKWFLAPVVSKPNPPQLTSKRCLESGSLENDIGDPLMWCSLSLYKSMEPLRKVLQSPWEYKHKKFLGLLEISAKLPLYYNIQPILVMLLLNIMINDNWSWSRIVKNRPLSLNSEVSVTLVT